MAQPRRGSRGLNNDIVHIVSYFEKQNKKVYHVMEVHFMDGSVVTLKNLRAFVDDEEEEEPF